MQTLGKVAFGTMMGVGALAFSLSAAPAAIVCSGDACWHAHSVYEYPPEAHVIVHPDDWRWGPSEHFVWREHEGRGYWHGDRWDEW